MIHSLTRIVILLVFIFIYSLSFGQNVIINYVNPPDFSVCDSVIFEASISNNTSDTLYSVTLKASMPVGVAYAAGSVLNATDLNLSNLYAPVFSLDSIPPDSSTTVTFMARTECGLVASINTGVLFTNTYTLDYTGGNVVEITTPYIIETALLQIVSLNEEVMNGVTGDVLTRQWTLANTRLGNISNLTFTDNYAGGLSITSPMGTTTNIGPGILEVELSGADFANFGDGDELLELNEQITITEFIEIIGCGDPPSSTSFLSASWGCHGAICQKVETTATVIISPNNDNPFVESFIYEPYPVDYCATAGNQQGIILVNNGSQPANDLALVISHFRSGEMGLEANSLNLSSGGDPISAQTDFFLPVTFEDCNKPDMVYDSVNIVILSIPAGDTVLIFWDAMICAVACDSDTPRWQYFFSHSKNCPADEEVTSGEVSGDMDLNQPLSQYVTYYIGQALTNNGIYELVYTLSSPLIVDSVGILQIDMELPCGIGWGNNNGFNLNGQFPDSINVLTNVNGQSNVSLYFNLPLGVDTVAAPFFINFECSGQCFDLPDCITEFVTSCPVLPVTGQSEMLPVSVNSTIFLQASACGPQDCEEFLLTYFCEATTNDICYDTVPGYFISEIDFKRKNLGLPDNDNDRFADTFGDINLDAIRRDRAITGDTVHTFISSTMKMDTPGDSISMARLVLQFQSHLEDDGWDGGSFLDSTYQYNLMTDGDGFKSLGGTVRIIDISSGDVYECELPSPLTIREKRTGKEVIVNTRPEDVLDLWHFLSYRYNISPEYLQQQGCDVPADWKFEEGDLVQADIFHKIMYKWQPINVINMRTAAIVVSENPPGGYFSCLPVSQRWQLSTYQYRTNPGLYEIPSCESSDSPGNTSFEFLLGMPNFFPYEFRSFVDINSWAYTPQGPGNLLSSKIAQLYVQGEAPLIEDLEWIWMNQGNSFVYDFLDIPFDTLDEGFHIDFYHEWELPCEAEQPVPLFVTAELDFASSLPEPDPFTYVVEGDLTLTPLRPDLEFLPNNINHVGITNQAFWEFDLTNLNTGNETAVNTWMNIFSPSGQLSDFQMFNTDTGMEIPFQNGIFQIGDLLPGSGFHYQIVASINNCEPDLIEVRFGWNCEPYLNLSQSVCNEELVVLSVSPLLGEIEMAVTSPTSDFQLCDSIGFHNIEIFNAQFGAIYDLILQANLPAGLSVLPGSCEMSYPTGTPYSPVSDPVMISADLVQWNLSDLNATLGTQGLPGFDQSPGHSVSLRFNATTKCGFISPSQIIFHAEAMQGCGLPANNLSKPGAELFLEGVTPLYEMDISLSADSLTTLTCEENLDLVFNLQASAETSNTDSISILLPAGLGFVPNSYIPISNAVPNAPNMVLSNNQTRMTWPFINGLAANSPISFQVSFTAISGGNCEGGEMEITTFQNQESECLNNGQPCTLAAETGRDTLQIIFDIPSLGLDAYQFEMINGIGHFNVLLENNGNSTGQNVYIDFYNDVDNSGDFSPGDNLLHSHEQSGGIGSGEIIPIAGSFPVFYSTACSIIAVVNGLNSCTCTEDVEVGPDLVTNLLPTDLICYGAIVEIGLGIPVLTGHSFEWVPPNGLSCSDCANPELNTNELNISQFPAQILIDQFDTYPNGCVLNNQFPISIGNTSSTEDLEISACVGEEILLDGPYNALSYFWQGPGISDPSLQSQIVMLQGPAEIQLEYIDIYSCTTTITYEISIPPAFAVDTIALCTGDSVIIDGVAYFDAVEDCFPTFVEGCSVIRCEYYEPRDTPVVQFPLDTVCVFEGTEITLDPLEDDFLNYSWSPSAPLSCVQCPNPTLEAINQTFDLTVTSFNQCRASTQVTVVAFPGCGDVSIKVPNVFTPNNDLVNDRFGPVMFPGLEKVISSANLRIYDRWGAKVFEGKGVDNVFWDGNFKNKSMAPDVYIFILEMACEEEEFVMKGDFTLLR